MSLSSKTIYKCKCDLCSSFKESEQKEKVLMKQMAFYSENLGTKSLYYICDKCYDWLHKQINTRRIETTEVAPLVG